VDFNLVSAKIAFGRRVVVGVDVESIVWAGLHAGLATDAAPVVEIDDAVGTPIEGRGGTDLDAWSIIAMIATHDPEVAGGIGKLALLDVLYPSAKYTNWHLVLFLAGDAAGMTSN